MTIPRLFAQPGVFHAAPNGLVGGAARPLLTDGAYLDGTNGLVSAGLSGNYASTPDSAALDITGDIEITARMSAIDWQGNWCVVAKRTLADGLSWQIATTTNIIAFSMRTGGVDYFNNYQASTTSLVDGTTYWLRFTRTASTGVVTIEYANDSVTEPTVWTSMSPTGTAVPGNIDANNAPVEFGSNRSGGFQNLPGTIRRVIIRNGIGGTVALDADFAAQTANALAFTESSSNAATVTINTSRYTYGIPGTTSGALSTSSMLANVDRYQPFIVHAPIIIDMVMLEVTASPTSASTFYLGIYALDNDRQPTGNALLATTLDIPTTPTGVYSKQFAGVTLQPGAYALATNPSVTFTVRTLNSGLPNVLGSYGSGGGALAFARARTAGSFGNNPNSWNLFGTGGTPGVLHYALLRWRAA